MLQSIEVTAANYSTAWDLLLSRYENKRLIIYSNLQKLTTLPAIKVESAAELKQLFDGTTEVIRSLQNLKRPVDQWDDWLVYITVEKLDITSRRDWEKSISSTADPVTYEQLRSFLERRVRELEILDNANPKQKTSTPKDVQSSRCRTHTTTSMTNERLCPVCSGKHFILFCAAFRKKTTEQRRDIITQKRLCYNCLSSYHLVKDCTSVKRCQVCGSNHHSMIHEQPRENSTSGSTDKASETKAHHSSQLNQLNRGVLLATAVVDLHSATQYVIPSARALLDQGSESSFVTESIAQQLRLKRKPVNITVYGLGSAATSTVRSIVTLTIQSKRIPSISYTIEALVFPKLTTYLPTVQSSSKEWSYLTDLQLADPDFSIPARVDLVLGADVYSQILLEGVRSGPPNSPVAQNTTLGWILSGPFHNSQGKQQVCSLHCITNEDLSSQLQQFWQVEENPSLNSQLSEDEIDCEKQFLATHRRDSQGRYIVRLPFKSTFNSAQLGDSYQPAFRLQLQTERRFLKNSNLASAYNSFMTEYINLGHMVLTSSTEISDTSEEIQYILPHHAITKMSSSTTKLRVVFNASQVATSGVSLNDVLLTGPKLQAELSTIISKWRIHKIVFGADITKMYRQIMVHPDDCKYQQILWRSNVSKPIEQYSLLTVTYGTACAPFLALRTLRQLAEDEQQQYPLGSQVLLNGMYIDDVFTGSNSVSEALERQRQLIGILQAGGFNLRKWVSNCSELLDRISPNDQESVVQLHPKTETAVPVLGLFWQPQSDTFRFQVQLSGETTEVTKHAILSDISRIFDPLGWLSPTIITAKILLQSLWLLKTDWDVRLPEVIEQQWRTYRSQLHSLHNISIPRWTGLESTVRTCELHGFADASTQAYAAVIYLRVINSKGQFQVTLLTAKTKVAPVKTISLPRLELCAATLLSRLVQVVREGVFATDSMPTHLWTDSTVVLAWIKNHASRWKTFVANRVSEIQTLNPTANWHHVSSAENPADCASRGVSPNELENQTLWWNGPRWLSQPASCWPSTTVLIDAEVDMERRTTVHVTNLPDRNCWDILHKYSSLSKLLRVTAYCQRLVSNCRIPKTERIQEHLTTNELLDARNFWIISVQKSFFATEYTALSNKDVLSTKSSLLKFKPFIDEIGLLRVGGRLRHAILPYDEKHPIVIPRNSPFTTMVISQAHKRTLHGGVQLTLSHLRRTFWILGGRSEVHKYIRHCRTCFPFRTATTVPVMADLPAERVQPFRPFLNTGVDYAGPIQLKASKGRGFRSYKGYISVFICMSTRAVHLEVVSDYSTQSFLAAYKRFTARRGICATLWSDQGTTFIGADNELRTLFQAASHQRQDIAEILANDGTDWKFIPPASPHFGGLWEAGVRSVKHHFRRVIGEQMLTYEEMTTFLCEAEACLNSRPIQAMSDEPTDLTALTPGHFLIDSACTTIPEPTLLDVKINRLTRWQLLRQMYEHFWKRWSAEYLSTLQARTKWRTTQHQVNVGNLVLIVDERLPPSKWPLARITTLHPGPDNEVRVVTLRTAGTLLTRPVAKLCFLPGMMRQDQ